MDTPQPGQSARDGRPQVTVTVRESEVTEQAVALLSQRNETLFDRGGKLVIVSMSDDTPQIEPVSVEWMRHLLSKELSFVRLSKSEEGDMVAKPCPPPKWVAPTIVKMPERPMFPRLVGVATSPIVRRDGTLVLKSGYDAASGWMVRIPDALEIRVPERPTAGDVKRAIAVLLDVVRDFPFEQPHHRSAALAYLFSLVMRTYYDGSTPYFLVGGTTKGAGKDLLVQSMTKIATGNPAAELSWPGSSTEDEKETIKLVHSAYLAGDPALCWCNIPTGSVFESTAFDRLVTAERWRGRTLSHSSMPILPNLAIWTVTGHGITIGADGSRRCIPCYLAPEEEQPEKRQGLRNLKTYIPENRGALLSAALTVVRGWIQAGAPVMVPVLGSFEGWVCVPSLLVWAEQPDPCIGMAEMRDLNDESDEELEMLHDGWAMAWGLEQVTADEVIERVQAGQSRDADNGLITYIRTECCLAKGSPRGKLGRMLQKYKGKWRNNRRLQKGKTGSRRWWQLQRRDSQTKLDALEPGSEG